MTLTLASDALLDDTLQQAPSSNFFEVNLEDPTLKFLLEE
jgi:hypothetical protein